MVSCLKYWYKPLCRRIKFIGDFIMNFKGFLLLAVILFCSVYVSVHGFFQHMARQYPELKQEITQAVKTESNNNITLTPLPSSGDSETLETIQQIPAATALPQGIRDRPLEKL